MIFLLAILCFASFGWGMRKYFRREGPMNRATKTTALLGAAAAVLDLTLLAPLAADWKPPSLALVVLFATGLGLFWWAILETRGKGLFAIGSGLVPPQRIRTGLYRWLRHPFYISYALVWLACWAASGSWLGSLPVAVMGCIYAREALREERDLLGLSDRTGLILDQTQRSDQVVESRFATKMA